MKPILETIDTRYGTDNSHSISHGNTLPYTGAPFGMNYFVPQSSHTDGSWFFNPDSPIFQGIRLTHQPSPWLVTTRGFSLLLSQKDTAFRYLPPPVFLSTRREYLPASLSKNQLQPLPDQH